MPLLKTVTLSVLIIHALIWAQFLNSTYLKLFNMYYIIPLNLARIVLIDNLYVDLTSITHLVFSLSTIQYIVYIL